jgi:hypothetical protein
MRTGPAPQEVRSPSQNGRKKKKKKRRKKRRKEEKRKRKDATETRREFR